MSQLKSNLSGLLVALWATVMIVLVRRFVSIPIFGFENPVVLFFLSVMVAASVSGISGGLFATVLGAAASVVVLIGERGWGKALPNNLPMRLVAFVAIGGLLSWLVGSLRADRRRIAERNKQLEHEVEERHRMAATEREQREQLAIEMHRREETEMALREQEERVRLAVEAANLGTWDFNPITGEQKWSSRAKLMCGHSAEADVSNLSFRDRVHPEDRERVNQAIQKAFDPSGDGVYEVDLRIVWPDNTIHWLVGKGQVLFEGEAANRRASRLIGTAFDVTERKQVEERLQASEGRLQAIMDNASAVIYLKDLQGRFLMINRRFEELLNVDQQLFLGKTDADVFPRDVVEMIHAHDRRVRETGQPLEFEEVVPHKDGPHTYIAVKFPVKDADGTVVAIGGISTDISDRKAIEDVVRASEMRLRGILDYMPAAISLKDLEERYVLVNRFFEDLLDAKADQLVGHTNHELISQARTNQMSKELADQFVRIDRKVVRTGEVVAFEDSRSFVDDSRLFSTVKFPIKDVSGSITGVGGISIDVTDRRKAMDLLAAEQEMLQHTIQFQDHERQLIAYEIHDGLVQYATGALMQLEGIQHQVTSQALAQQIENVVAIQRMTVVEGRRIISGLHATVLDDCGVVAAVQELIDKEERTQIEFVKDENLGRMARKSEEALYRIAQEALTNIYKHSQSNKVRIELGRSGDRVHLKVRDWGMGFTPDATAKGVHGLRGMAERARIAGGQCTIENARGGGTQVLVDLPYLSRN